MVKCGPDCIDECDFCIYCKHEETEVNGEIVYCEPIYCELHKINFETDVAPWPCEDFHCFLVK